MIRAAETIDPAHRPRPYETTGYTVADTNAETIDPAHRPRPYETTGYSVADTNAETIDPAHRPRPADPAASGLRIDDIGGPGAAEPSTEAPGTGAATVVEPDIRPVTDDGDHDRFAHYTRRKDAARSYVEGTPLRALCGKVWVPSRDPSRYPVCPECEKIRQSLRRRAFN